MKLKQKSKFILILLVIVCSIYTQEVDKNTLVLTSFKESQGAKCNDGSPYGVYYAPGSGNGIKKVIINIWAGGWCNQRTKEEVLYRCIGRLRSYLGSSRYWKEKEINKDHGYLSGDPIKNRLFHNYHRFDFPYCDSAGNQGFASNPEIIFGTDIFFRGYQNTREAINFLRRKIDFLEIDTIVITGCSSAALATLHWIQYISDLAKEINPKIEVFGISNGGFFIDHINLITNDNDFRIKLQTLFNMVNKESSIPLKECVEENKDNPLNCMFPEIFLKYVKPPVLLLQSLYDRWQIDEILGEKCISNSTMTNCDINQKKNIDNFRIYTKEKIFRMQNLKKNLSIWSPSCIIHCFNDEDRNSPNWQVPEDSGNTVDNVVERFLNSRGNEQIILIDEVEWPFNKKCSNYDPNSVLKYEISGNVKTSNLKNETYIQNGLLYLKIDIIYAYIYIFIMILLSFN
jgi:hypothetical protein